MFIRSTALYFAARGLPAIVNFLAIALYTRFLSPEQYGRYILIVAAAGFANILLFHWLRHGVLRFLPRTGERPEALLSTLLFGFGASVLISAAGAILAYLLIAEPLSRSVILFGTLLLWVQAWFDLNLHVTESQVRPVRFGLFSGLRAVVGLLVGIGLVLLSAGFLGPTIGLVAGTAIAAFGLMIGQWPGVRRRLVDPALLRAVLAYSLPLTATLGLDMVVASSDRFFLAWLAGTAEAGAYAAAYDLGWMSLTTILMVVNLAGYPLTVRKLEQSGPDAAREQLGQTFLLLLAIGLPAAVGMAICAAGITSVVLGPAFQETGALLLPWVAAACLIAGLKAYYLDLSFQLSFRTMGQVWIALAAASLNIVLNILLIPTLGVFGAIYATLVSFGLAAVLSWHFGARVFRRPALPAEAIKPALAAAAMALALWPYRSAAGPLGLAGQIVLGVGVYVAVMTMMDFLGLRQRLRARLAARRERSA